MITFHYDYYCTYFFETNKKENGIDSTYLIGSCAYLEKYSFWSLLVTSNQFGFSIIFILTFDKNFVFSGMIALSKIEIRGCKIQDVSTSFSVDFQNP